MCNLSGKYSDRNTKYSISCIGSATRNTTGILAERERGIQKKEKCMWRFQPRCLGFGTPPLFPETADHTCSLSVCTCFSISIFPFCWMYAPLKSPFSLQEENHLRLNQFAGEKPG